MCLIQCVGIWIVNGNFGIGWKLVQAVVQKPKPTLSGQCFLKLKSVDKEKLQSQRVPEEDAISEDHVASSIVDDSDEEEEEEEEVEKLMPPVPPPAPASVPAPVVLKVEPEDESKKVVKKVIKKKV